MQHTVSGTGLRLVDFRKRARIPAASWLLFIDLLNEGAADFPGPFFSLKCGTLFGPFHFEGQGFS
jgi:hypothetical protein